MEAKARAYVEGLLARGRHTFTREEAETALKTSAIASYHSLRRLQKRGWLAMPRRGFYPPSIPSTGRWARCRPPRGSMT